MIDMQTERLWPDPDRGPWLLRASFATEGDVVVPVGLELWAVRPPGPGSAWLRWRPDLPERLAGWPLVPLVTERLRVPLVRLSDELVAAARHARGRWPALQAAAKTHRRRGRPPLYDDPHFVRVAQAYRQATRAPTLAVSAEFGVPRSTATKWVAQARRRGMLA